ncbi:MAG: hypothetical protein AB2705_13395 [Candidatus Thiodiazotropha sp.]
MRETGSLFALRLETVDQERECRIRENTMRSMSTTAAYCNQRAIEPV